METRRRLVGLLLPILAAAMAFQACTELGEDDSPHPGGWGDGPLLHTAKLRASRYDLNSCRACHGEDLRGTDEVLGCNTCHVAETGLFACNKCHADETTPVFEDLLGDTSIDLVTVGAHTSHYTAAHALTSNISCSACHQVPDSLFAAGHLFGFQDSTTYADITWSDLATDGGATAPLWDRNTGTCSQVYCHGSFAYGSITGNDSTWTWTQPAPANLCGTCHGLPPTGHSQVDGVEQCGTCHRNVVDPNDNRRIIGLSLHINGGSNF